MPKMIRPLLPLASIVMIALAGCASQPERPVVVEKKVEYVTPPETVVPVTPVATQVTRIEETRVPANVQFPRVVYFDFDSYAIRPDDTETIKTHAKRLALNPQLHEVIEGHTDNRGSSEYNLALGLKRADSVVKALMLMGAEGHQLEAVSFGKQQPAAEGNNELSWAKNRRVVFKDR